MKTLLLQLDFKFLKDITDIYYNSLFPTDLPKADHRADVHKIFTD